MEHVADAFEDERREDTRRLGEDEGLRARSMPWVAEVSRYRYSYHFNWLARPIIQFPQDIVARQEIIWELRPGLIVETGIARGGSLIFSASMMELLSGDGRVVGVDIDIRAHNRAEIERHPMQGRIRMIEGSSVTRRSSRAGGARSRAPESRDGDPRFGPHPRSCAA